MSCNLEVNPQTLRQERVQDSHRDQLSDYAPTTGCYLDLESRQPEDAEISRPNTINIYSYKLLATFTGIISRTRRLQLQSPGLMSSFQQAARPLWKNSAGEE